MAIYMDKQVFTFLRASSSAFFLASSSRLASSSARAFASTACLCSSSFLSLSSSSSLFIRASSSACYQKHLVSDLRPTVWHSNMKCKRTTSIKLITYNATVKKCVFTWKKVRSAPFDTCAKLVLEATNFITKDYASLPSSLSGLAI